MMRVAWAVLATVVLVGGAQAAAPAGWKTYTNKKDGYSVAYPPDWPLNGDFYDGVSEQGAPHGISVATPDSMKQGTNLDNATFSVEGVHDKACTSDKFDSDISTAFGNVHTFAADGRSYTGGQSKDVASGDTYENDVFVVDGLSRCIAVHYFWRINDMKRYIPGEAKPFDVDGLRKTMDQIRATLTFKK